MAGIHKDMAEISANLIQLFRDKGCIVYPISKDFNNIWRFLCLIRHSFFRCLTNRQVTSHFLLELV